MTPEQKHRIELIVVIALLTILAIGCIAVLRPFLTALFWALIVSIATWPAFEWLKDHLRGHKTIAALLMTLVLFSALLLPILAVGSTVAETLRGLPEQVRIIEEEGLPGPPEWLETVPLIGHRVWLRWYEISLDPARLSSQLREYIRPLTETLLGIGARLGGGVLELTLSVFAAFFFYRDGAAGEQLLRTGLFRLVGDQGKRLIAVATGTLKGVVYGIIGTALAQAILLAFGLWLAGVPAPFFLGVLTFFLSIVPPGPILIWVPAAAWLVSQDQVEWAIFMAIWGFGVVGTIDNFIKPYFISRGSAMPLLLVFLGVLGGVFAFGLLGIFIGPTLLAVAYTIIKEWTAQAVHRIEADVKV
jgi:predicted PurR-regulated permease PerM